MVTIGLGLTIFVLTVDHVVTASIGFFIIYHYLLAYLAHYLAKQINECKLLHLPLGSNNNNCGSGITTTTYVYQPRFPRQTLHNNDIPYQDLDPPPSYNSINVLTNQPTIASNSNMPVWSSLRQPTM